LLRRPQRIVGPLLQVGKLEFNDATSELHCRGNLVQLRPAERRLLNLLLRRSGTVVSKTLIEEALSQSEREVSHNALEANMSRLRKALEEVDSGVVIETLRGMGYMLRPTNAGPSCSSRAATEVH